MQRECGQSGGWWPTTPISTAKADDVSASTRIYLVGTKQRWGAKSGPRPSYSSCPRLARGLTNHAAAVGAGLLIVAPLPRTALRTRIR
jgi:hypothetical protein